MAIEWLGDWCWLDMAAIVVRVYGSARFINMEMPELQPCQLQPWQLQP